jgi:hypothetical protein
LFQIAAPDMLSNAAKQEMVMSELTRFQIRQIRFQSPTFNFERASVALLSRLKQHRRFVTVPPLGSEWRDPPGFRMDDAARQEVRHG